MFRVRKIALCLSIGFSLMIPSIAAQAEDQLIKVGFPAFAPFIFEENGDLGGIWGEQFKVLFKEAGYRYTVEELPINRAKVAIVEGVVDFVPAIKTYPEYQGNVIHSEKPFSPLTLEVYGLDVEPPIKSREDMKGKSFIVNNGYTYGTLLAFMEDAANNITITAQVRGPEQGLSALISKRAPYYLEYPEKIAVALREVSVPNLKASTLYKLDIYFNISNRTPNKEQVMKKLEETWWRLKENPNF